MKVKRRKRAMDGLTEELFLNDKEVKELLRVLNKHKGERDSLMIRTALFTGARGAEIVQIKRQDLGDSAITIYGKKQGLNRTIPVPKDFFNELIDLHQKQPENDRIFNISTKTFRRAWEKYTPNPNKTSHALRHTCAVLFYRKFKDILLVKSILGHKSINCTLIYLSFVETQDRLASVVNDFWCKENEFA